MDIYDYLCTIILTFPRYILSQIIRWKNNTKPHDTFI